MKPEVDGADAIRNHTEALLRKAEARGRFPTPVDDIIAAAGLTQPTESLLSASIIEQAPEHIRRAARRVGLKIRAILDRKAREIHLDPLIHVEGRVAFKKLHEVAHDILPWQRALAYADDDKTLSWTTQRLWEQQANQGAAELLFQRDHFKDVANQYEISMASILELAGQVGASGHAAFRRFVDQNRSAVAGVVMDLSPCRSDPVGYRRREVVGSDTWVDRFGGPESWPSILHSPPYTFIELAGQARLSSDAVRGAVALPDANNLAVNLDVEVYSNQYKFFALLWVPKRQLFRHRRLIVPNADRR
jgi:hypothetical protein